MKKIIVLLLALCMAGAFAGCNNGSSSGDGGEGATERDNVVISLKSDPKTFDPVTTSTSSANTVMFQIYDSLIHMNEDFKVEPRLAKSYSVSDDEKTYTFKLVEDVKFHNGETLKADDVVYSIKRAQKSPYTSAYVDSVDSVEAIDENTVAIHLTDVDASFLEKIQIIMIVNEKTVEEAGDAYADHPVGTGPYKFVSYKAGVEVKLTSFDDYYRGKARIKDVDYKIITDDNTATVNLRTGDVDAGSFARASYDEVINEPTLTVADWSANSLYYFAVNNEVAPFDDPVVRQAMNYAIDREYIAEVETNGLSKITSVMLPPSVFGYSDKIDQTYTYDPDKARELLKKAGIKTPMKIGTIKIPEGDGKNAAEALQQCLSEIGLEVDIDILEQNKFYDETDFGDYEIAWCQISLLRDADSYSILFTSDQIDGMNTARYSNPKVDQLFAQAKSTTDQKERLKLYAECFNIIGKDAAYIPVYVPTNIYAYNKNLKIDVLEPSVQFVYDMHWN